KISLIGAHVGPDHPVAFAARIGLDPYALFQAAADRFGRHVGRGARDVEFPAVVDASQTAILVSREDHRRAAVRTSLIDQPDTPLRIPKGNEVLAQQPDPLRLP